MNTTLKKTVACVLLFVLPVSILAQAQPAMEMMDCERSRIEGENQARNAHSTSGWFLGGVGSGVLLGLIGTGIIAGASAMSKPQPKQIPSHVDSVCYVNGFTKEAKTRNIRSALGGGLVGTAVIVTIFVMNQPKQ